MKANNYKSDCHAELVSASLKLISAIHKNDGVRFQNRFGITKSLLFIMVFILLFTFPSFSQDSKINWSSFGGGSGISNSGNSVITSSVGISFSGSSANGSSSILSGFLTNYSIIITDIKDDHQIIPTVYKLNQNYPNPFNPSTIINYQIPEEGFITLKVYDIIGKEVKTLINENKPAGSYNVKFDASDLSSGIYIYRIRANNFVQSRKMLLIK